MRLQRWLSYLTVAVLAGSGSIGMASTAAADGSSTYSGTVAGCPWNVNLDTDAETVDATIDCSGSSGLGVSASASAGYSVITGDADGSGQTEINVNSITVTVAGVQYTDDLGISLDVPVDLSTVQNAQAQLQQFVQHLEAQAAEYAMETVADLGGALDLQNQVQHLESVQQELCQQSYQQGFSPVFGCDSDAAFAGPGCPPSNPPVPCFSTAEFGERDIISSENSDGGVDQSELCPGLDTFFDLSDSPNIYVCIPTFVQGDWNAKKKNIVLLPGAALIALPIGGDPTNGGLTAGPTISTSGSIVSLGGFAAGYDITFKAGKDVDLTATDFQLIHDFTVKAKNISIGSLNIDAATGGDIKNKSWYSGGPGDPGSDATSGTVKVPAIVQAAGIHFDATKSVTVTKGSRLDTQGYGPLGGVAGSNTSPGGAHDNWGGSHGGFGSYPAQTSGFDDRFEYTAMESRGKTFDSPFAPTQGGAGGSADSDDFTGTPGGGFIGIHAPLADVTLDGTLTTNGLDDGVNDSIRGAAGAGGGVNVVAGTLSGAGTLTADGGNFCSNCHNSWGGSGGGGRIAVVYHKTSKWKPTIQAYGGWDRQFVGFNNGVSSPEYRGTGGAGTVFTRQVAYTKSGSIQKGLGTYTDGTLRIDGGRPAGYFPPPDGTPLPDSWSSAHRQLVITGEAAVYGHSLNYKTISVANGTLTTMGTSIPETLTIKAQKLAVGSHGRIDMTGRGEPGSDGQQSPGAGGAVSGQQPATDGYGGSHAGRGGGIPSSQQQDDGKPGSTYDSPRKPALPGGGGAGATMASSSPGAPGGGVLTITVKTLIDQGVIAADGGSTDGPTRTNPAAFAIGGAAGAGGAILIHAQKVSGKGHITASGGDACLAPKSRLDGSSCGSQGAGGGGGGGDVALYTHTCKPAVALLAIGGYDESAWPENVGYTRGQKGKTYLSVPASCRKH